MARGNEAPGIAEAFDRSHSGRMRSDSVERIYRAAFGDDYAQDVQPNAFYSRTTLRRLADALEAGPGRTVVDLGCGHGRPSLWVAQQTGANLIGIDLSPVGIELARYRAAELGLAEQARFRAGDIATTGLADASCDAAMSLDVLPFVPDKGAAIGEVARILRPGSRFAFTIWEHLGGSAAADTDRAALAGTFQAHPLLESADVDYRRLLNDTGFAVEIYEEPPGWRSQQRALAEGIIAAEQDVTHEMGAHYPAMARVFIAALPTARYVIVAARRLPSRTMAIHGEVPTSKNQKVRPRFMIIDATEFFHRPGEGTLAWRDENIVPLYNDAGVEKFAFLTTADMPGTVEKGGEPRPDGPATFPTGWFETKERMYAWLTS